MQDKLVVAMSDLDQKLVYQLVEEYCKKGMSRNELLVLLNEGMQAVGHRYEAGVYFLADLIFSGVVYENVLKMDVMRSNKERKKDILGTVIVGTVAGDVHDIGKTILVNMLLSNGFIVHDVGVDASPESFINAVKGFKPQIVCISGIMSFSVQEIKNTINALRYAGLRDDIKILVGGNYILKEILNDLGADDYGENALEGLNICLKYVNRDMT